MPTITFNSIPTKTLAESITSAATSFRLNNITGWDGNALTSADFGDTGYAVFRNATNTAVEFFEFDPSTIASSSITITRRGLYYNASDLTTEVTANKLSWTKGDTYVDLGTDTPQMLQWMKEYIDAASIAGAVPATNSVQGITKLSVAAATASNPIAVGDNDPRVPTSDENDALAGTGTPSSSNKFVTEDYMVQVQEFTSGGTWTKPTGLTYAVVEAWGAGGSGAKEVAGAAYAGGGGGGAYVRKMFAASELGATETVTLGSGGAAASSNGNGNNGGNTTFGSLLTAYGGGAGQVGTPGTGGGGGGTFSAASGATAGNGDGQGGPSDDTTFTYPTNGGGGHGGTSDASGAGAGGAAVNGGGGGGSCSLSTGGSAAAGGTSINGGSGGAGGDTGTAGTQPGGGGGASDNGNSGAGADGMVRVTEYFG